MEDVARRQVLDRAGRRVDAQLIAGLDLLDVLADLQERQADVDAIAVKDAREARGDDDRDARCLDGNRRMLARGAAAEVAAADHDVAFLDIRCEALVDVDHAVLGELFRVKRVEVTGRDDDIRIDIVAVAPYFSF